jgi:hypothetical protein
MPRKREPDARPSARAANLRKKIGELDNSSDAPEKGERPPLSPRDFIHKRMAELDEKKGS